jgi:glyoxylase-like metal-dependent hydrolase (beta-lactamase superfamily II)
VGESAATRRFGDAEVTILDHGRLLAREDEVPEAIRGWRWLQRRHDGSVVWPMKGVVVRTRDALVVVDPGGPVEGSARFERGRGLDALQVARDEVTHVVITHGHADHFVGVLQGDTRELRFPEAEHVFPRRDSPLHPVLEPVAEVGRLRLVDGDASVCEGVDVLSAPGETPGHQVVRVRARSGSFYFLGDLVHVADEIDHIEWLSFPDELDGDVLPVSRERVFADQGDVPATFVFAHGPHPGWGRIQRAGDGWQWRPDETTA